MNPEPFDDLTRLLASSGSRRQVLTGLVGLAAGTLFAPLLQRTAFAAAKSPCSGLAPAPTTTQIAAGVQPASFIDLDQNRITDDCNTAVNLMTQGKVYVPGASSIEIKTGSVGYTDADFENATNTFDYTKKKKGGQYCVTTTQITLQFSVTTASYRIVWTPQCPGCEQLAPTCAAEIARWQKQTALHEGWHVADAKAIRDTTNTFWQNNSTNPKLLPATVCNSDASFASQAQQIQQSVTTLANNQLNCMVVTFKTQGTDFDTTQSKTEIGLQCPQCGCTTPAHVASLAATGTLVSCGTQCCDASQCQTCDTSSNTCVSSCTRCAPCDLASGTCVPITCPTCTECNPSTGTCDPVDCGSPCLTCQNNSCVSTCAEPTPQCGANGCFCGGIVCNGQCIDPFDDHNCGACGNDCTQLYPDGICWEQVNNTGGVVSIRYYCAPCPGGKGYCVDVGHCCAAAETCCGPSLCCPAGQGCCPGGCADLGSDPSNCGHCDNQCLTGACYYGDCACDSDADCDQSLGQRCCPTQQFFAGGQWWSGVCNVGGRVAFSVCDGSSGRTCCIVPDPSSVCLDGVCTGEQSTSRPFSEF